ncbi:2-hydroxyisoflavanone dehydratase-like [Humulus lupulus]|uniref:2-hydroxyisoflavanone dehydratase-like n=1 Tax=Humulus lupulus TaxID=3486 RepID=UPI002B40BA7D|nr:2-hydroxyisoflavanone dehydratase-like [Humulus lupulus]
MASTVTSNKEIVTEILPFVRVYKDGTVERLTESPFVPPSPYNQHDPETGVPVSSKDILISREPTIGARLFLPNLPPNHNQTTKEKLPILVYFHGGGFFFESAFSADHHQFLNSLVSEAKVIAVSVEYRLAPEHHLPIAYEDCWIALQRVASLSSTQHKNNDIFEEPWLTDHGDFGRIFLGGDSAGANIAHNIAMRVGKEGLQNGVKVLGAFLTHPLFWGSSEEDRDEKTMSLINVVWNFVYPSAPCGIDNPMMNPEGPESPSLAGIGCSRLLVSVAEKDVLRERGIRYYEAVRESGWNGEIELVDVEGEDHAFQILHGDTYNSKNLVKRLARFLLK